MSERKLLPSSARPFPYHAFVRSGRNNTHKNPFNFQRTKDIRNFDPLSVKLPFTLEIEQVREYCGDMLAHSGQFEVIQLVGVYARQLIEMKFGTTSPYEDRIDEATYRQGRIVTSADVIGRLTLADGCVDEQQLYEAYLTNYRSYHADDIGFTLIPPETNAIPLSEPIDITRYY